MMTYKKRLENSNQQLIRAMAETKIVEHVVPVRENTKSQKKEWDPDDWLNIE
jgi:hypothetical protein